MTQHTYRLVTRSDFDGLVCGMLLRDKGLIDDVTFVHPKDMQDGMVPIGPRDIITNLPFVEGCHLAFDHHASEVARNGLDGPANHIIDADAPSTARVVYDYFGGREAFPNIDADMLDAVDRADMALFTRDEILDPQGWALLNFIMDPRTGLGRFKSFRISNYALMMELIDKCRLLPIDAVLRLPDVVERLDLYRAQSGAFMAQQLRCARVHGSLVVVDLRGEETIWAGSRFLIYALFPQCDMSLSIMWGLRRQNVIFAVGKSILDRGSLVDVGTVCLTYEGGGHHGAGTCQVPPDRAEEVKNDLISRLPRAPADSLESGPLFQAA